MTSPARKFDAIRSNCGDNDLPFARYAHNVKTLSTGAL